MDAEKVIDRVAWVAPILWVVPWATFRGAFAHGGYVWWETVHIDGAIVLLFAGLALRGVMWWRPARGQGRRSVARFAGGQVALVAVAVTASWLCFQIGLAYHLPPRSIGEFLWQDP